MSLRHARPAGRGLLALSGALAVAGGLVGCSSTTPGDAIPSHTLTIYASLPADGASQLSSAAAVNGARMALSDAGGRIGRYRVRLRVLDDSTPQRGEWDPGQTTINARTAASDPTTIAYIGEFDSGASAVSIPVLNRAGIVQVSPASTAVGLTSAGPGASPGEPEKYYPSGVRTFVRVVPSDEVQAAVQVILQRRAGCRSTYVLDDGEVDGEDAASSFTVSAQSAGLPLAAVSAFSPGSSDYSGQAAAVGSSGADCVLVDSSLASGAVLLSEQVAAAAPRAKLFATAQLAVPGYVDARLGGLPAALDRRLLITYPVLGPPDLPPAGQRFLMRYAARFGTPPPAAIDGYEAMSLVLDAIARASHDGKRAVRRSRVLRAVFATRNRPSVLGTYSVRHSGDTTLRRYGVFRVRHGKLVYEGAIRG